MQDITEIDISNTVKGLVCLCLSVCLSVSVSVLPCVLVHCQGFREKEKDWVCMYVCVGSISVNFIYLMCIVLCQRCNEEELLGLPFYETPTVNIRNWVVFLSVCPSVSLSSLASSWLLQSRSISVLTSTSRWQKSPNSSKLSSLVTTMSPLPATWSCWAYLPNWYGSKLPSWALSVTAPRLGWTRYGQGLWALGNYYVLNFSPIMLQGCIVSLAKYLSRAHTCVARSRLISRLSQCVGLIVDTKTSGLTILGMLGIVTYVYVRHKRVTQRAVVFLLFSQWT